MKTGACRSSKLAGNAESVRRCEQLSRPASSGQQVGHQLSWCWWPRGRTEEKLLFFWFCIKFYHFFVHFCRFFEFFWQVMCRLCGLCTWHSERADKNCALALRRHIAMTLSRTGHTSWTVEQIASQIPDMVRVCRRKRAGWCYFEEILLETVVEKTSLGRF